jgi:ferrochelatase
MPKTGILLVNLGTPQSPHIKDVYRYLIEFLTDERVIDVPWLKRQLLVRGMIVPARIRSSTRSYAQIWTPEGSPLLVYGRKVVDALQAQLGSDYHVELAMRYQVPSIETGLQKLSAAGVDKIVVIPLFPQYASATTGSVHQKVMETVKRWNVIPEIKFVNSYADHPGLIQAFCARLSEHVLKDYDHLIFSFHGLPERHLQNADPHGQCLKRSGCCNKVTDRNKHCYSAQCQATVKGIVKQLNIPADFYTVCYQSRLGKEPWLQPYASQVIAQKQKEKVKNLLVISPAFVCDCLETLYEIGIEYAQEFTHAGGGRLQLVGGLNEHPLWISALKSLVLEHS